MGDTTNIPIHIPSDNDGFLTFQCPFCSELFKLAVEDVESEDVSELFCPYCGLISGASKFHRSKVIEHCETVAMNHAVDLVNDFLKQLERGSRGAFKVETKPLKKEEPKVLFEAENHLDIVQFDCCAKSAKVVGLYKQLGAYCPYCGVKE